MDMNQNSKLDPIENNAIRPGLEETNSIGRVSYILCPRCHREITSKWQLVICPFCEYYFCPSCNE
jgi:uncharacterized CHY-type Zn-finger protein